MKYTEGIEHKFPYEWKMSDGYPAKGIKYHGLKVFSCFACGGGSTMGYKLAGYDVIGCNEIDPKMNGCYNWNHNPKFNFLEPIQEFKLRDDLPPELYNLDILGGSPPCSSFSMAGNREKDWGKKKKFKEGQQEQALDTLFFDFIDVAKKLKPKVVLAENVKGLLQGNARKYLEGIGNAFRDAGYKFSYKLLDASKMGVPQRRERAFFYAIRNDLIDKIETEDMFGDVPYLKLEFYEKEIVFGKIKDSTYHCKYDRNLTDHYMEYWNLRVKGDKNFSMSSARMGRNKMAQFGYMYLYDHKVANTMLACDHNVIFDESRYCNFKELLSISSFPIDYNFIKSKPEYIMGMSVPPVMSAQIATRIYEQWFSKIYE